MTDFNTDQGWHPSNDILANKRLICVFDTPVEFTELCYNPVEDGFINNMNIPDITLRWVCYHTCIKKRKSIMLKEYRKTLECLLNRAQKSETSKEAVEYSEAVVNLVNLSHTSREFLKELAGDDDQETVKKYANSSETPKPNPELTIMDFGPVLQEILDDMYDKIRKADNSDSVSKSEIKTESTEDRVRLIKKCADNKGIIICRTTKRADHLMKMAQDRSIKIPHPIIWDNGVVWVKKHYTVYLDKE